MTRRPTPPSPPSASSPPPHRAHTIDVRAWLAASRLSGFVAIMLTLVVLAVFVLVPSVGTYVGQRQQITALEHSVVVTKDEVADLQRQRARWKDPAFITAQARARLYYVTPGEVVYLIDDDLPDASAPREQAPISDEVVTTRTDWMSQLVRSVTATGLSRTATSQGGSPQDGSSQDGSSQGGSSQPDPSGSG